MRIFHAKKYNTNVTDLKTTLTMTKNKQDQLFIILMFTEIRVNISKGFFFTFLKIITFVWASNTNCVRMRPNAVTRLFLNVDTVPQTDSTQIYRTIFHYTNCFCHHQYKFMLFYDSRIHFYNSWIWTIIKYFIKYMWNCFLINISRFL